MPLPPAFGTVTIVEDYVDFTGAVGTGTVTFIPVANDWLDMPGSNTIIVPKPITVGIDANGHMTITVPLTDDPDVVPTYTYSVTENVSGLSRTRTIEVPSALLPGPLVLSDLAPTNAGSVGTTALTKAEADALYAVKGAGGGTVDTSALLAKANNLSDVPNKATARGNLGLGTASTQPTSAFATSSDLTALSATIAGQVAAAVPVNVLATGLVYNGTAVNAKFDGTSHPLSGIFPNLAAAQTIFPAAMALTDELDYHVIQKYLTDGHAIQMPAGTGMLHGRPLVIPNGLTTGLALRGRGKGVTRLKHRDNAIAAHAGCTATAGSATVLDPSVTAGDVGKYVMGAGMPTGATIATVTPGVSFTLGNGKTGFNGTGTVYVGNGSVIIDQGHLDAGYDFNLALTVTESTSLTLEDFTVDGNRANIGSNLHPVYHFGVGIGGQSNTTVDLEVINGIGWGYREQGTSNAYVQNGTYAVRASGNGCWGFYLGYRNRRKTVKTVIVNNNGVAGLVGTNKGTAITTYFGGAVLDASEMTVQHISAHGNNSDGVLIRNVFGCTYNQFRAYANGGAGIRGLALVSDIGMDWIAHNNGVNPGNGQANAASTGLTGNGISGGSTGTATGYPDVWLDDTVNGITNYGITNHTVISGIACGPDGASASTYPAVESHALWVDDGITGDVQVLDVSPSTGTVRLPAAPGTLRVRLASEAAGTGGSYTDEQAQDATAAALAAGTHSGITFTYDDTANKISAAVTGGGGAASPDYSLISGGWYAPSSSSLAQNAMTLNTMLLSLTRLPSPTTIQAFKNEVTVAGTTGGVIRVGFYGITANGLPDLSNLIADIGTQPSTAAAMNTWSGLSVALPKLFYTAVVAQGATCSIRAVANGFPDPVPLPSGFTPATGSAYQHLAVTGVSGTLPTSGTVTALNQTPPKIFLQAA